jgi:hypothetical protein
VTVYSFGLEEIAMVADNLRRHSGRQQRAAAQQAMDWVEDYPFASVAVMFGIGVGVGLVVGHTIAEAAGRRMFHHDTLAERLSCQIRDVLRNSLPRAFSGQA